MVQVLFESGKVEFSSQKASTGYIFVNYYLAVLYFGAIDSAQKMYKAFTSRLLLVWLCKPAKATYNNQV